MDLTKVLVSIFVVAIALVGVFTWVDDLNTDYGETAGSTFNDSLNKVDLTTELSSIGTSLGDSAITDSGANTGTGVIALVSKGLTAITTLPTLIGLIPSVMNGFMSVLGIPVGIQLFIRFLFIGVFALTIAYLLILGVQKFAG